MNEVFEQLFNAACAALNVTNDNDSTPVNWLTVSENCRQEFIFAVCGFKGLDGFLPPRPLTPATEKILVALELGAMVDKFGFNVVIDLLADLANERGAEKANPQGLAEPETLHYLLAEQLQELANKTKI